MSIIPRNMGAVIQSPKVTSSQRIPSQIKTMMGMKVNQHRTRYVVRLMEAP